VFTVGAIQVVVHDVDHLTTWLTVVGTVVGALSVAVIAAVTAQARLNRRLDAELQRHREQLAFNRGETDRAEVRELIDGLAEQLGLLSEAADDARTAVHVLADDWNEDDGPIAHKSLQDAREALEHQVAGMVLRLQKLRLRLGDESKDLVELASRARGEAMTLVAELMIFDPRRGTDLPRIDRERNRVRKLVGEFMESARRYTQAQLVRPSATPSAPRTDGPRASQDRLLVPTLAGDDPTLRYRPDEASLKTFLRRRRAISATRRTRGKRSQTELGEADDD
jgi:hypothetical protein